MEPNVHNLYEYVMCEMLPDLYIGGCEVGYKGTLYVEYTDDDTGEQYYIEVAEWLTTDGLLDDVLASDEVSDEQLHDLAARVELVIRSEYETYLKSQLTLLTGDTNG